MNAPLEWRAPSGGASERCLAYHVSMDTARLKHFIETFWEDSILPSITEYIRIPNKSPAFDPQWVEHGYMEDAVTLMAGWARPQLDVAQPVGSSPRKLSGRHCLEPTKIPGE